MLGLIISGSCNIFTVEKNVEGECRYFECRIKGKVLKNSGGYNPLAPGDIVDFEEDNQQIISLQKRKNVFERLNTKNNKAQVLAANIDLVICVTSLLNPPWRPRFIDRVLLQCEAENIPSMILVNKIDLQEFPLPKEVQERLDNFKQLGSDVHFVSTVSAEGMNELRKKLHGKTSVLAGQSAVGKSSILNCLFPDANLKTGALNQKYDRGNHTTVQSRLFKNADFTVIDTPGIRQFVPCGIPKSEIINYMRDIQTHALKCEYGASCTHSGEKGCMVQAALKDGSINADRFTSFLNIVQCLI
ncbi:MAG: ribosome small subunit-dependent GTPase A [Termitinemataceae bacterium]|nr:MAG: ribosome small subunit-dependent GTPase A [Termitinemataceae bacterium]